MSSYLLINILIIAIPLVLTFEKNIQYYKKLPALIFSIIITGAILIFWDSIATSRGDWGFNEKYILGIKFFYLPLEEILFFITVPFSTIFIYETLNFYLRDKTLNIPNSVFIIISISLAAIAIIFNGQYYTFTVLIFTSIFLILTGLIFPSLLNSKIYWLYILISYIPFLIVNYILTSLPIVWYNDSAFFGKRFITIPYEDFFYSFSLLSYYIFFYLKFSEWQKRKKR